MGSFDNTPPKEARQSCENRWEKRAGETPEGNLPQSGKILFANR